VDDPGPDCSCGCRWYVRLEPGLQLDWGICRNPASPRCGLLTFEHQGCRAFEADDGHVRETEAEVTKTGGREVEVRLLGRMRERETELRSQLEASSDHWGYEDPVYRFYHQSFKVYWLQERTRALAGLLAELAPTDRPLDPWFLEIVREGTGREFTPEDNARWTEATRPVLEAFFHARYFVEMAVRYATLDEPPRFLPSGYAALLCLYGLR